MVPDLWTGNEDMSATIIPMRREPEPDNPVIWYRQNIAQRVEELIVMEATFRELGERIPLLKTELSLIRAHE